MSQDIHAGNSSGIPKFARRPANEDDFDDPTFEFGDDGPTVYNISEDNSDRMARIALFDKALSISPPHVVVAYEAMKLALASHREKIAARLVDGHLLIAVTMPSAAWSAVTQKAFELFVLESVIDAGPSIGHHVRQHAAQRARFFPAGYGFDASTILDSARALHSVINVAPDELLPSFMHLACDAIIKVDQIGQSIFQRMLDRLFPDEGAEWPDDIDAWLIEPKMLTAAMKRCRSAAEAVELAISYSAHQAIDLAKAAAATEAEAAKAKPAAKAKGAEITRPTSPKLDDLHGYGPAQMWAQQLADDISAYGDGELEWRDVDGGCLLHGPPGTGKTLFASALAASCELPFIASSFAHWQGAKGGHLGDVVGAIRAVFAAANDSAPCILFIDEIDSIPARGSSRDHNDYWTPIVTCLLECLDGSSRREGVVVLAACNHHEGLDPALVRSGRLDRHFEIGLPGEEDLVRIFQHHLPDLDASVITPVATALAGMTSGADVARISREARRSARRAKRDLVAEDLLAIALPVDDRPEELRRLIAVHEAGHAVVAMTFGIIPRSLTTIRSGNAAGGVVVEHAANGGRLGDIHRHVTICLAGRAAEEVVFGQVSAGAGGQGGSDLESATVILAKAVGMMGMHNSLVFHDRADGGLIEGQLQRLYAETVLICVRRRIEILALAELALERRVLGRKALSDFAGEFHLGGSE